MTPKYDIFIGIISLRFGTPTGVAGSGTEEEYRMASSLVGREQHDAADALFLSKAVHAATD
jgi:hypothetical protein